MAHIRAARQARWPRTPVTASARSPNLRETVPEGGLIALALRGDDSAFGELVRRRQGSIRGLLRRWCGDSQLADELAQETFVQAWKHLRRLESPGAFGGWLRQIALNVWLQHARRKNIPMDDLHDGDAREAAPVDTGAAIDLERALGALRPPERVCIVLCFGEGMSHGDIARATGFPLGTVKSHVSERFDRGVRARIARLRWAKRVLLPTTAVATAVTVAILGAPLFATGAAFVADASLTLNDAVGPLIVSPAGFALGALTVVAALVDTFND